MKRSSRTGCLHSVASALGPLVNDESALNRLRQPRKASAAIEPESSPDLATSTTPTFRFAATAAKTKVEDEEEEEEEERKRETKRRRRGDLRLHSAVGSRRSLHEEGETQSALEIALGWPTDSSPRPTSEPPARTQKLKRTQGLVSFRATTKRSSP